MNQNSESPAKPNRPKSLDVEITPFTIVRDTREGAPYGFQGFTADAPNAGVPVVVQITDACLKTGDYSLVGHENEIAIERKEVSDFLGCLGGDRDRFTAQLERLNTMKHGFVVVETGWMSEDDWDAYLVDQGRSKMNGKSIARSIIAWQQRLPHVHWMFCGTRRTAEQFVYQSLRRFWIDAHDDF